ncbi:hypothetical protein B0H14DRAFT_3875017 [Mycena olivaceomarginata]|nr:hypothetical protein B0H14DRAFT_3875017 [Mycena olivaceomarginata]
MAPSQNPRKMRSARDRERSSMSGTGAHFASPPKPRDPRKNQLKRKNPGGVSEPPQPDLALPSAADPPEDVEMPDWRSCDAINALSAALRTIYDRCGFQVMSSMKPDVPDSPPEEGGGCTRIGESPATTSAPVQASADTSAPHVDHVVLAAADGPAPIATSAPTAPTSASSQASAAADTSAVLADTSAPTQDHVEYPPQADTHTPPAAPGSPDSPPLPVQQLQAPHPATDRLADVSAPAAAVSDSAPLCAPPVSCVNGVPLVLAWKNGAAHQKKVVTFRLAVMVVSAIVMFVGPGMAPSLTIHPISSRKQRKGKPATLAPLIPQEVLDACNATFDAANEKKRNTDPKFYDASGVFVMQKYVLAGLEELMSLLPPKPPLLRHTTSGVKLTGSLDLFPLLTEGVRERVPPPASGYGLDGWGRGGAILVKDPQAHRNDPASNLRHIWTIDQYTAFVNEDGLNRLGDWIVRQRETNLPKKYKAATKTIRECGVPVTEFRSQWAAQKAAETSIRACKFRLADPSAGSRGRRLPCALKQELSKLLGLQTQIDAVEQSIEDTKKSVTGPNAAPESLDLLRSLEATHETLSTQMLYSSLNIHEGISELRGLPLAFVTLLMTMRDLKIEIRRRAINSFKELATLRRAVAGQREANGTKLNTATRRVIEKRKPALLRQISKYNTYCAEIAEDWPPQ